MTDEQSSSKNHFLMLALGALGVVFGDIGTSPLYALRECFSGADGVAIDRNSVLGMLSLIFWALTIVISLKYVVFVMRADHKGEGGVLALMVLSHLKSRKGGFEGRVLIYLGLFGAALLYGDGMITPAISVLSAVEGLEIITPFFRPYVIPITTIILLSLFWVQSHGTGKIGSIFGPFILLWFAVLALLGILGIAHAPSVLMALSPWYALIFIVHEGPRSLAILGGVFLAVTGGEALYADMGHFGRNPIQAGWFTVALPGLVLNYFGQGALILSNPATLKNPFYLLAPNWALVPMVLLATVATVIASQAVITGAFSLTRQAIHLGYLPRMEISHTSSTQIGQIYAALVNRMLLIFTLWLVFEFRSSGNLAAAYGIAVSTTMVITTTLMFIVARDVWRWKRVLRLPVFSFFLVIDLVFLAANLIKIKNGGWFPLAVGLGIFTLMTTWRSGREILARRLRQGLLPLESFIRTLAECPPPRAPGTAIFLTRNVDSAPPALTHFLDHIKALHEQIVLLMVVTEEVPYVDPYARVRMERLGHGFFRIVAHYGFIESPNILEVLEECKETGLDFDSAELTFVLGRETIIATSLPGMAMWREKLFALMSRNAEHPSNFFQLPRNRVMEIGLQVEI